MKAKKFLILSIVLLVCFSISCTDKFDEINTNPNKLEEISPGTLLNTTLYEVAAFNTARAGAFTFDIMQVALPYPSASGGIHRYDIAENGGNSTWNTYYRWLYNIKEMKKEAVALEDKNYEAIARTLNAWVFSLLTDCFGDVPMDEALRGDERLFYPTFNTQQEIYTRILADLDTANTMFNTSASAAMIYGTEILYNNNVANWKKFCNSLKLRLLLRVSKRAEMNAFARMAEIIADDKKYPIFTSKEDAAILKITGFGGNISPWGRAVDFTTGRATAAFFIDSLNAFRDPRLALFNSQAKSKDGKTNIGYKGIPSGYAGSDSQFNFQPSNFNQALVIAPMISVIMSYAEVEFIKAELAFRGVIASSAQTHYENAVKAAILQWSASDYQLPSTYFTSNPRAAYNGKLERIMLQKYYALFFNDYQQWIEYRRTGLPVLPKGGALRNNGIMPVRFKYPEIQQTNNRAHYDEAVSRMGGDNINVKVWWEKD